MKQLKLWRERLKLKKQEAAAKFGVDPSTYGRWESGNFPVSINRVAKLSKITGIPAVKFRPDIFKGL